MEQLEVWYNPKIEHDLVQSTGTTGADGTICIRGLLLSLLAASLILSVTVREEQRVNDSD